LFANITPRIYENHVLTKQPHPQWKQNRAIDSTHH